MSDTAKTQETKPAKAEETKPAAPAAAAADAASATGSATKAEPVAKPSTAAESQPTKGEAAEPQQKEGGDDEEGGGNENEQDQEDHEAEEELKKVNLEPDEEVLFKMRAKLYRFENSSNEWKERGLGDIKILRHKDTHKCRVLMRRERVHKVCANHLILPQMKLDPHSGSERSWVYQALDFSEGELRHETLAIRFSNSEVATQFKQVFESAREEMKKVVEQEQKSAQTHASASS